MGPLFMLFAPLKDVQIILQWQPGRMWLRAQVDSGLIYWLVLGSYF